MNLAELTSLEQLIVLMVSKGMIQQDIIDVVWTIFCKMRIIFLKALILTFPSAKF